MKEADFPEVSELIDIICSRCGIPTLCHNLSDEEIARVCRWIGEHAPDAVQLEEKVGIGAMGYDTMIFLTITEFPTFFEKNMLAMVWRN